MKLTAAKEGRIRRLCAVETVPEAVPLLETIAGLTDESGGWFPEHLAAGSDEFDGSEEHNRRLKSMLMLLVPLLSGGLVECIGDTNRLVRSYWIRCTDAGREAVEVGTQTDATDEFDQVAGDLYDLDWDGYGDYLASLKPEDEQKLVIPFPASIGWGSRRVLVEQRRAAISSAG